ncbi:Elongation factor P--(R)-beta-lysine ligase [Commensalibacter sp. Nvir]|uniref:EF-P lysine aminoacylase EpmA n=1 Tax=Commensalibacter sp. Nvir TaxID=3069817 RepID=UPI002D3F7168|nr:Elongation factor P--(R)-beta-lysine ligase [Commensalibacter sp. Nvir]
MQNVSIQEKLPFLLKRQILKNEIRNFFLKKNYFEVDTPFMVTSPGEEVHLYPFQTCYETPYGEKKNLYLHTSPEFSMKKILASLHRPIYQFARVWRNGEGGKLHAPEFTMLEWYHPYYSLEELMRETESLLQALLPAKINYNQSCIAFNKPFERLTVNQAFQNYVGVDLLSLPEDPFVLSQAANCSLRNSETWEDLFFRLLMERIEPYIGRDRPTFLTHWPVSQAALAKIDSQDTRVALRFELYAGGLELANAFEELNDPLEQRARFVKDRKKRFLLYPSRPIWQLDESFLASLTSLPPCSGIALGFERLVMLATGAMDIKDILWI